MMETVIEPRISCSHEEAQSIIYGTTSVSQNEFYILADYYVQKPLEKFIYANRMPTKYNPSRTCPIP